MSDTPLDCFMGVPIVADETMPPRRNVASCYDQTTGTIRLPLAEAIDLIWLMLWFDAGCSRVPQ